MPTEQLLIRLPQELIHRFRRKVPDRQRSAFVRALLEKALDVHGDQGDQPYEAALATEQRSHAAEHMVTWEEAAVAGGLGDGVVRK